MNGLFKKIMQKKEVLTKLELSVVDGLYENRNRISNLTLKEFSKKIFISEATISRTCKKFGFKGFSEFKFILKQYKGIESQMYNYKNSAEGYIQHIKEEFNNNINYIHKEDIEEIVNILITSRRIEVFGIGRSLSVCQEGASKLSFSGCNTSARSDRDEQLIVANGLETVDCGIFVSVSGETSELITIAKTLFESNVPTISLIGRRGSTLERLSDKTIALDLMPIHIGDVDMSSHHMFAIIFNLMSITYMESKI